MFEESQNRLYSMGLIHEKLYRSTNLAQINFGEYLEDLVTNLFHSYNISDNRIQLQVLAEPIYLNLETATPCGLIANELVSNTLKHAFPDGTTGTVSVECYQTGDREIHLFIKDNGIGFPQNIDFRKTNSMGFQVVCTLTDQLEGSIELSRQTGTAFHLKLNELSYSKRF
jgi:two-component sensor histidine kinase